MAFSPPLKDRKNRDLSFKLKSDRVNLNRGYLLHYKSVSQKGPFNQQISLKTLKYEQIKKDYKSVR